MAALLEDAPIHLDRVPDLCDDPVLGQHPLFQLRLLLGQRATLFDDALSATQLGTKPLKLPPQPLQFPPLTQAAERH